MLPEVLAILLPEVSMLAIATAAMINPGFTDHASEASFEHTDDESHLSAMSGSSGAHVQERARGESQTVADTVD